MTNEQVLQNARLDAARQALRKARQVVKNMKVWVYHCEGRRQAASEFCWTVAQVAKQAINYACPRERHVYEQVVTHALAERDKRYAQEAQAREAWREAKWQEAIALEA
jgi:hypothetical protein